MKKLGLIGGTGPESTVMYYRGIISGVGERLGDEVLPPLVIDSLSPFEVFQYCGAGDMTGLTDYLLRAVENLAAGGAEFAAMTAATTHIVFGEVQAKSPVPLVSMVEATVSQAKQVGAERIGLMGTKFTMTNDFFVTPFEAQAMSVTVPNAAEIDIIQGRIANELEHGIVTDAAKAEFIEIIERLNAEHGIDQLILGCTELPLILNDGVSPVACLDPVPVHIRSLVDEIVAGH